MFDTDTIHALLRRIADGAISPDAALAELRAAPRSYAELGDFARVDLRRAERTGVPEIIYGAGKTPGQIVAIARRMIEAGLVNIIATRLADDAHRAVLDAFPGARSYDLCRAVRVAPADQLPLPGHVAVVTAGTADLPVAEEVELVCDVLGSRTQRWADIGIACLERTLDALPALRTASVLVCAAGMEAALPSVLAGLLRIPIIAVPVSAGYGVNAGGYNALLSVLGSCVPGVLAVNIDNGVGAAVAAHRIHAAICADAPL